MFSCDESRLWKAYSPRLLGWAWFGARFQQVEGSWWVYVQLKCAVMALPVAFFWLIGRDGPRSDPAQGNNGELA